MTFEEWQASAYNGETLTTSMAFYGCAASRDAEVAELRNDVKILWDAVAKAADHVKPTCNDLYEELMQSLASTKRHDRS